MPGPERVGHAIGGAAASGLAVWAATETNGVLSVLLVVWAVLIVLGTLVNISK